MPGSLRLATHVWLGVFELWVVTGGTGGIIVLIAVIFFNCHKRSPGIFLSPKIHQNGLTRKTRLDTNFIGTHHSGRRNNSK